MEILCLSFTTNQKNLDRKSKCLINHKVSLEIEDGFPGIQDISTVVQEANLSLVALRNGLIYLRAKYHVQYSMGLVTSRLPQSLSNAERANDKCEKNNTLMDKCLAE